MCKYLESASHRQKERERDGEEESEESGWLIRNAREERRDDILETVKMVA